jgi:general secretion pathway protein D
MRSTVSIQSGDTIVLGGLISENNQRTRAGLPGLSQIPILGLLFGQDSVKSDRTELLVLITPSVVRNSEDARTVTEEITRKLNVLKTFNELIDTPRSQTYQLLR